MAPKKTTTKKEQKKKDTEEQPVPGPFEAAMYRLTLKGYINDGHLCQEVWIARDRGDR
jgi:hypothetical protein